LANSDFGELDFLPKLGSRGVRSMPKRPPLTVVAPHASGRPAPATLGEAGRELWAAIQAEYSVDDAVGCEILRQACCGADRAASLAATVAVDGEIIHGRQGPRPHPGLQAEMQARAFTVRCLEKLGVTFEPIGRIGRPGGKRAD
jgi:hypothetical protein